MLNQSRASSRTAWRLLGIALISCALASAARAAEGTPDVRFNRDVRPILSNYCYKCHGPDENERQAGLRLDVPEVAFGELDSGERVIVPGDIEASELVARITHDDEYLRMPPTDEEKQLSPDEIETLKRWVVAGAEYEGHWAFTPPERPQLPEVEQTDWPRNPIDTFILARLEAEGLAPSPEADKPTLIRRATFDLTGLPPTIEEIDAYLADTSEAAYETVIERLLDSPHYGEHMARHWLDYARYGDTHGLHLDNERSIWPYRDWVISAFNDNMPFDQFTIEQLAGDLLPQPELDQLVATGFNRCNVTTSEGGAIDEEFRVRYAVDRVETTATVWMGLTLGCAVCHDHKYDPFTQKEFYSLFAFFNSLTEKAMDGNRLDPPPTVRVPSDELAVQIDAMSEEVAAARQKVDELGAVVAEAQTAWESQWRERLAGTWRPLELQEFTSQNGTSLAKLDDGSLLAGGENPEKDVYEIVAPIDGPIIALQLVALTDESLPAKGPGRSDNSNFVLSEIEVEVAGSQSPTEFEQVSFAAATADLSQKGFPPTAAVDGALDPATGWAIAGFDHHEPRAAIFYFDRPVGDEGSVLRVRLHQVSQYAQHTIGRLRLSVAVDEPLLPVALGRWYTVGPFPADDGNTAFATAFPPESGVDLAATYEAGLAWSPRDDLIDGAAVELSGENGATYLYREVYVPEARTLRLGFGSDDALRVWLNDQLVLDRNVQRGHAANADEVDLELEPGVNRLLCKVVNYGGAYAFSCNKLSEGGTDVPLQLAAALALGPESRTPDQQQQINSYYRDRHAPEWAAASARLATLEQEKQQLVEQAPQSLVMEDMAEPRQAYLLIRGEYDNRGDPVDPGVPAALPPMPEGAPVNRLGLARWLVDPSHPLTARVVVNRYWQRYFGTGLVRTSEDFGSQGQWPSHPELLDWLAVEFIESGWDIEHMQRLIVSSATYRQSAHVTEELVARDPQNRLLARGSRFRLDAEVIRDNALAVSGLLVPAVGGPSVKPYQPLGIWKAVGYTSSNTANFQRDDGEALYRRSMYTFWKRTAPPPSMQTFDAPTREACTVRRARTNTPLQALVLMNDVQFVEAARKFAERIMHEGGTTPAERVRYAFRLATARTPDDAEVDVLEAAYNDLVAQYQQQKFAAVRLVTAGEAPRDESLDVIELAAWTVVGSVIRTLDATVSQG